MRNRYHSASLPSWTTLLATLTLAPFAVARGIERVPNGVQPNGASGLMNLSADGRYIVFHSQAMNLAGLDLNGPNDDIFLLDRQTGITKNLTSTPPTPQDHDYSYCPTITPDGRFVSFMSFDNGIVATDTNGSSDTFVYDTVTGIYEVTSRSTSGNSVGGQHTFPTISDDGRYVAFACYNAAMASPPALDTFYNIYLRDRQAGTTIRLTQGLNGTGMEFDAEVPVISGNGQYVVFSSKASNLVPNDTNGTYDVFRIAVSSGAIELVSVANGGGPSNGYAYCGGFDAMTPDGRFVVFESGASNLVAGDTNNKTDVFVRDMQLGVTTLLSRSATGVLSNGNSFWPVISDDGRFVAFESLAFNLIPGDLANRDVFVVDRLLGSVERVSENAANQTATSGSSYQATINADGRVIAFISSATTLIATDTNFVPDVYLVERCFLETIPNGLVSTPGSGGLSPVLSGVTGACVSGGYQIALGNALGGASGILFVGAGFADIPNVLGGHFYIDPTLPFVSLPFVFGGAAGVPGAGSLSIPAADASAFIGATIQMQFAVSDPGGFLGIALSNGLSLKIAE